MRQNHSLQDKRREGGHRFVAGLLVGAGLFLAAPAIQAAESLAIGGYTVAASSVLQPAVSLGQDIGEYVTSVSPLQQPRNSTIENAGEYVVGE